MEARAHFDRGVDLERVAVGDDRDVVVVAVASLGSTTPPSTMERLAGRRHRADHHLAQQELDRVEMLGAFEVVRVELRADAFDRVGDAVERLRQLEVAADERSDRTGRSRRRGVVVGAELAIAATTTSPRCAARAVHACPMPSSRLGRRPDRGARRRVPCEARAFPRGGPGRRGGASARCTPAATLNLW